MSGYQPFATLRAIVVSGPPPMPVVDRALVGRPERSAPVAPAKQAGSSRKFVTTRMVSAMRRRRSEGVSLRVIASEFGCCQYTVRKHTRDVRPPTGEWSKGGCASRLDVDRAARLRRAGFTYREIGEEIGCTQSGAHRLLQGTRSAKRNSRLRPTDLVQLVAKVAGCSCAELRAPLRGMPKKGSARVSKARAILFWLARVRLASATFDSIGRALGGFEGTTVSDGYYRVQAAIERLSIPPRTQPGRYVRPLWRADWLDGRGHH